MSIARRVDGSDTHATSVTSLSVTLGTVPVDDDQLVAILHHIQQDDPSSVPAGWALIASQDAGANIRALVYMKIALSETGVYAWTIPVSTKCGLWVGCYSGCDPATPPTAVSAALSSTSSAVCPDALIPDQGWLVSAVGARHAGTGAGATTWTNSAGGDSERLDFGSNAGSGQDIAMAVYDSAGAVSGPTTLHRTLTASRTESQLAVFGVVLSPPPVAPSGLTGRWGVFV